MPTYLEVRVLQILIPQSVEIDLNEDQEKVEMFILVNNTPIARILAEKIFKVFHGDDVSTCKIHLVLANSMPVEAQNPSFKKE